MTAAHKPTYQCWQDMKQRCTNQKHAQFKNYGARGILICDAWSEFDAFLSDMGEKPAGLTLDRIENSGNYEPSNCRWATKTEQRVNQRTVNLLAFNGELKPLRYWANEYGMTESTLHTRLRLGWSIELAITTPVNKKLSGYSALGKIARWASQPAMPIAAQGGKSCG